MDISEVTAEEAIRLYWAHLGPSREGEEFANLVVRYFDASADEIDATIRGVSHHWRLERMTRVDRNILRLATTELLKVEDVPSKVTLNEAIELAKRFGSEGSPGFVNGVLDRIASDVGKA